MSVYFFRVFYNLWLLGAFILFFNAASYALFGRSKADGNLKRIVNALALSLVWPLGLFSPAGRKVLLGKFHKL